MKYQMRAALAAVGIAISPRIIESAPPRVTLRSSVDGAPATADWKYARIGQAVILQAQLSPARAGVHLRWFKLEPTVGSVDNTTPRFHFAPIAYQATEIEACRDRPTCPADVSPTRLPEVDAVPGAGTMAFQVKVAWPDGTSAATPGLEAIEYGGLAKRVHRVTFRRDDTYLGYLTELFNTPYIFGSAGEDGRNQSDLLIGSDCADLAVYGRRRLGKPTAYTSSFAIDRLAPEIARATTQDAEGVAHDARGAPLRFRGAAPGGEGQVELAPGDLIHFPSTKHVAVLYEDRPPLGVLDAADLMLHTCWAPPTIEPLGASGCVSLPMRILRFR